MASQRSSSFHKEIIVGSRRYHDPNNNSNKRGLLSSFEELVSHKADNECISFAELVSRNSNKGMISFADLVKKRKSPTKEVVSFADHVNRSLRRDEHPTSVASSSFRSSSRQQQQQPIFAMVDMMTGDGSFGSSDGGTRDEADQIETILPTLKARLARRKLEMEHRVGSGYDDDDEPSEILGESQTELLSDAPTAA